MDKVKCRQCRYFRLKRTLDKVWHPVCTFNDDEPRVKPDREHFCEFFVSDLNKE